MHLSIHPPGQAINKSKRKEDFFFQMLPGWAGWTPVYVLNIDPDHGLHHASNTRLLEVGL